MRLVFMGTPEFAVPVLARLIAAGHQIACVYSQPPRPAGRGLEPMRSPVHRAAVAAGLPVRTPGRLRDAGEPEALHALTADALVVVAYGLLLPRAALDAARLGAFNLHASKLPRWRGAAPIQRAIMAGDAVTAATVMRMAEGLDTGPVCLEADVKIGADETAGSLYDRLSERGAALVADAMAALEAGTLRETPQSGDGITYAQKIDKAEARLDFAKPALIVHNTIRGLSPFPGAWFEIARAGLKSERVKVLRSNLVAGSGTPGAVLDSALTIACGSGAVRLIEVQRAGRKSAPADEFLRGFPVAKGEQVG